MSRIIIKNLPSVGIKEDDIKDHFKDIDNITDVRLKYNDSGVFRRFAFVGFKSQDAAEKAIAKLDKSFIKNSRISLDICKAIKEAKPREFSTKDRKNRGKGEVTEVENDKLSDSIDKADKSSAIEDEFERLKDDNEFKEFLKLQRNIKDGKETKQIWSDDAVMDVENVSVPREPPKQSELETEEESKPRKRHKRSRGKKKSTKTKPKELFVHTIKIKGLPTEIRRKEVKDFFKPLEILSIRNNKRDEVCYVSFKDESDLKFAMRKNMHFCGTSRVRLWKHDVKKSRVFKETVREKVREKEDTIKRFEETLANTEPVEESGRLFVRNLNYTCTQEDLEEVFSKYGELTEVHFPIDKTTSLPKGYAYVEFMFPQNAARAYEELNGTIFQGRNFHLIPSKPKPESRRPEGLIGNDNGSARSSFKRERQVAQKESANKGSNWNILFLGQNALADVVSDKRGVSKSKLLTQQTHKDPIAVRLALGDATVVDEVRKFLISNGVELDSFDNTLAPRSRTTIIVKNLPASTGKLELTDLFQTHGRVARVIMPPNGLTAIVEMEEAVEAKLAFKKLAYSKYKDSVLYLEWAPINVFKEKSLEDQERSDLKQLEEAQTGTKILVKNVPFEATVQELKKIFASYGELNFVRLPKKLDGQHRGFGFVDFLTKEDALRAFRALCHSTHLYGRKLVLEWAKTDDISADKNK